MARSDTPCRVADCGKQSVGHRLCRKHYQRWYKHGDPLGGKTPKGAQQAWILANVAHRGASCLVWPFCRKKSGVGSATFHGRKMNASRAMCIAAHGKPPALHYDAAHSCGNAHGGCVNPAHLRWATKVENQADRHLHGTMLFGTRNPAGKLTDEQVSAIRALKGCATHKVIAAKFSVSRQYVGELLSGRARPG